LAGISLFKFKLQSKMFSLDFWAHRQILSRALDF
jgi:hypothetical protein